MAEWTGLEPATPGVTGRYSNQLNYHSALGEISNIMAERTGLEPATPGVTGRYSNQLNYRSSFHKQSGIKLFPTAGADNTFRPSKGQ